MKVIFSCSNDFTNKFKTEKDMAFSQSSQTFLVRDKDYERLNVKYNFEKIEDDTEGEVYIYKTFEEYLSETWTNDSIEINADFARVSLEISDMVETVMERYDEHYKPYSDKEYYPNEGEIDELFSAEDWYSTLYKETKLLMLSLWIDSAKSEVDDLIKAIENS